MKRALFSLIAVCFSLMALSQELYPYLQAPSQNSIFINWINHTANTPTIIYGTSSTNLSTTVTGTDNLFTQGSYSYHYNKVEVVGLQPNTKYFYKVISNEQESDTLSFKTLPLPGGANSADGHFRFLIMGDNQINESGRYDTLVAQAKRKVEEKFGGDASDNIALTFMVGDQVDLGNLLDYEQVHFKFNRELSGLVPIQTTVGNHETYGGLGMTSYYNHFEIDQFLYQGISSGTENYYAMQAGNVLLISLSSEHTGNEQYNWLQSVMNAASTDNTVDWILTFSHRPYEAEQYVGDISSWVKNTAVPFCMENEKYIMHVGAHHHIYSRGQFRDEPVYNILSGGTAWDQYWGQSNESDFEYIQKTISQWCYQIVDVDLENERIDIETYSTGSPIMFNNGERLNNVLVDQFHRQKNQATPNTPSILNIPNNAITLPFTFNSSDFETSTAEELNTTHFQVSATNDFSVLEVDLLRDFENLFGQAPGQDPDSTQDLMAGVNILEFTANQNSLNNGNHYIRVRHRDKNLEWSNWSLPQLFAIENSTLSADPYVSMDSSSYFLGSPLLATYGNGPGNSTDWVGIYPIDVTPGGPASTAWQYCTGPSGIINFGANQITTSGLYYAGFFENDGYNEIAQRDTFYYGMIPVIDSDTNEYATGETIVLEITNAPANADSLEVLKVGLMHGVHTPVFWGAITENAQNIDLGSTVEKGYYTAKYYYNGEVIIGDPFYFSVGDTITALTIDKSIYELDEDIVATWTDAPGIVKDWLGIYHADDDPNSDPLISYAYFDGQAFGTKTLSDTLLPDAVGEYFVVMFTDDSYTEVSNRKNFTVIDPFAGVEELDQGLKVYPNPVSTGKKVNVFSSDYPIEFIEVQDLSGKVLYRTENVNNNQHSVLTEDFPSGTYIINIQTRKLYQYKMVVL